MLCKVTAAPQVTCFIYIYKKEVSFLISGQAIAGVGGMPGSLREEPRAATSVSRQCRNCPALGAAPPSDVAVRAP